MWRGSDDPVRVLIATCSHRGDDARIVQRQARSLCAAGHDVVLIAPAPHQPAPIEHVEIPRAIGRRRLHAWRAVNRAVRRHQNAAVLIVHDLELLMPLAVVRGLPPLVIDIHEDLAASVVDRTWLPRPVRRIAAAVVHRLERRAERIGTVIAAEHSYTDRLGPVPVVPNTTSVPINRAPAKPGDVRVTYVGRISRGRGWDTIRDVARRLTGRVEVHLYGEPDPEVRSDVEDAHRAGEVVWHGYTVNTKALEDIEGSLVGLSLLGDLPNYRHSMPTKIVEYLAHGIPVISSDLPASRAIVEASHGGWIVPPDNAGAVVEIIAQLLADPARRDMAAMAGHDYVAHHLNWDRDAADFIALVERVGRSR